MGGVIAGMTVSLDGFVTDENGYFGSPYPGFVKLQGPPKGCASGS